MGNLLPNCIVVGNTVTGLCAGMPVGSNVCQLNINMNPEAIPGMHLKISGTISTTNVIMANWATEMWQSVVNRAVRALASGPFGTNFFSAFAIVS